jgi:glutamate-ammonia-ligase adenylyltransferase
MNTIAGLQRLVAKELLEHADAKSLIDAARFQLALTQILRIAVGGRFEPESASEGIKALLVRAGGAQDFGALEERLAEAQTKTHQIFDRLLSP